MSVVVSFLFVIMNVVVNSSLIICLGRIDPLYVNYAAYLFAED